MRKRLLSNRRCPLKHHRVAGFAPWQIVAALALLAALLGFVILAVSHRASGEHGRSIGKHDAHTPSGSSFSNSPSPTPISSRKAKATWYDVPADSLAGRRAASDEYTAAHDSLPLGALVRVTNLKNQTSVLVRITDRGIHNRNVQIDLCKEAAEALGMIRQGVARVRLEVLPDVHTGEPPATETAAP